MSTKLETEERREAWHPGDGYGREWVSGVRFTPQHPTAQGQGLVDQLWKRIANGLPGDFDPDQTPKDCGKWATLPGWLDLMVKHPHTERNFFTWMDKAVGKKGVTLNSGALRVRKMRDYSMARMRQFGSGVNVPKPAFTFHGERLPYRDVRDLAMKWIRTADYPDPEVRTLDMESIDSWFSVQGSRCSTYIFAESTMLFHGCSPQQETPFPIPHDVFEQAWTTVLDREFPRLKDGKIRPKEMFVGTGPSGGVRIQKKDAAAGWPYVNMSTEEFQDYAGRPKFKGRINKGAAFPSAYRDLVKWVREGMPMSGPLYKRLAQPATLAYRGDREVSLELLAAANRGPEVQYHAAQDQLAALFPGRSVIIVPTILILAQSMWAQPLGDHIGSTAPPGFDWADPAVTSQRLDELRRQDLAKTGSTPIECGGADASGWDRDVTGQDHAGETAWYLAVSPEEVRLLHVDSELPIDVDDEWVRARKEELSDGEYREYEVTGIATDGSERLTTVKASPVSFNFHEFIVKIMTMINDAPVTWADYEADSTGVICTLPGTDHHDMKCIVSNGGRRSGDAATGIGNSWSNLVKLESMSLMSRDPKLLALLGKRAAIAGEEPPRPFLVVDALTRGDDSAVLIELPSGGHFSTCLAGGYSGVGMRANAKKQESSDIAGKPVFAFANILVTANYIGKLLGRSLKRFMVQETAGVSMEMLQAVRDVGNESEFSDIMVATTSTAKSRLAPLAGFPLMSVHPAASQVVDWAVDNDEHRLAYVTDNSLDENGVLTDDAKEATQKAREVEARVQGRLAAARSNTPGIEDSTKDAYYDANIHALVLERAFSPSYSAPLKMKRYDANLEFRELVATGQSAQLVSN